MTLENEYERIGKLIYTAYRHGGDVVDVNNWIADDLGIARPQINDEVVPADMYSAFFAKYANRDAFQANYECFVDMLKANGT